jgi:hypothetical protein
MRHERVYGFRALGAVIGDVSGKSASAPTRGKGPRVSIALSENWSIDLAAAISRLPRLR